MHDKARVLQHRLQLLQVLEILPHPLAHQVTQGRGIDVVGAAGEQLLLHLLELLHLVHEIEGLPVVERLWPVEQVFVAALEIFHSTDVVELLHQLVERLLRCRVLELVAREHLQLFAETPGEVFEEGLLLGEVRFLRAALSQGLLFLVQEVVELLLQLVKG